MGVEPAARSRRGRGSRPGRTVRGCFRSASRPVERGAQKQGRSPQFRRLDLRRHLHAHRQAVRDRLGRQGRFDDLLLQRSSDQARDHVRSRREDRRLAILALLLPQLRQPGSGRAARRPAGRRRLHQGLHALHQASGDGRRQDHGSALLLRGVDLELLLGHAGEAQDRQAVRQLRRIHRALRKSQEGRRVALSRPVDRRCRPRAVAGHLVPDDLQPRRHVLRQAGQPHAGRRLGRPRDAEMVGQYLREGPRHRRS